MILSMLEHMEGHREHTALHAAIALVVTATIEATATTAGGGMDEIDWLALGIVDGRLGKATVAVLFKFSQVSTIVGGELELLVAATLARTGGAFPWAGQGENGLAGVDVIDSHLKPLTALAPKPTAATTIFDTVSELFGISTRSVKPVEFGLGLASETLLKPALARLADGHGGGIAKVARH